MLFVDECIFQSEQVMVVVLVVLAIELCEPDISMNLPISAQETHQVQDRHLHHTLVEVCGLVLDDLDGNNLLRFQVLALDDLSECPLSQHIQNEVPVPAGSAYVSHETVKTVELTCGLHLHFQGYR